MLRSALQSLVLLGTSALVFAACSGPSIRAFPNEEALWDDTDTQHVEESPSIYFSGLAWDFVDQTFFRSMNRYLRVDDTRPAVNVNAMDEVPDSSWFENRLGWRDLTVEEARRGACPEDTLRPENGPWTVTDAKPNGANPGFIIRDPEGRRWLLKFDGLDQPERATTADVFGSRVYHAAGFHAPCNTVVYFDADVLAIADDAEVENAVGEDIPMEDHHVQRVLDAAVTLPDGRLRASASLYISGGYLGPWTYQGVRKDDPNDVIPHEDRRELRGARLLAAWVNHFDAREQNTLAMFHEEDDGTRYVRHYYLDFGDCLGSRWDQDGLSRRFGHAYYFDMAEIGADWFSFGARVSPWDTQEVSTEAPAIGYFDAEHFDPVNWKNGYPNPAFGRMQEGDGAWMARIIADISGEHVRAMLDEGRVLDETLDAEIFRVLMARRQMILDHWLLVRSPLADPVVEGDQVCLTDLATREGVLTPDAVRYEARAWWSTRGSLSDADAWTQPKWHATIAQPSWSYEESEAPREQVCIPLTHGELGRPADNARGAELGFDRYQIVDVNVVPHTGGDALPPLRLHFYDEGESFRLVGIERPADDAPPAETR